LISRTAGVPRHRERIFGGVVAGEEDCDGDGAGGHLIELKGAVAFGVRDLIGAFDPHLGIADVLLIGGVEDAALDGAGRLSKQRRDGRQPADAECEPAIW
jgi:hypothetical protein